MHESVWAIGVTIVCRMASVICIIVVAVRVLGLGQYCVLGGMEVADMDERGFDENAEQQHCQQAGTHQASTHGDQTNHFAESTPVFPFLSIRLG